MDDVMMIHREEKVTTKHGTVMRRLVYDDINDQRRLRREFKQTFAAAAIVMIV